MDYCFPVRQVLIDAVDFVEHRLKHLDASIRYLRRERSARSTALWALAEAKQVGCDKNTRESRLQCVTAL